MDNPSIPLIITIICILIFINAFFALSETALFESHKSRLEKLADDGNKDALRALKILEDPEPAETVIQIGITLISILLGTVSGVLIADFIDKKILDIYMEHLPLHGPISLAISITAVTYLTLMLSEFIPRRLALQTPERTLMKCQKTLRRLIFWTKPIVGILSLSAKVILNILGISHKVEDTVTEDEVKDLIEQGTDDGTFEKTEQAMVDRIFHMSDQKAYSLMTARTQMVWLDLEDSTEHNLNIIKSNPDLIIPVGSGSLDDFCGVIYAKDLLDAAIDHQKLDINNFIRKPLFVPRSMETLKVLEQFRKTGHQEAMVMDEYGGVVGFITLRDILLELIGENIIDEPDPQYIIACGENHNEWHIDGLCSIDDFKEKFDIDELPAEEEDHYQTMGGFATSQFGYIPKAGEQFTWGDFTFEILKLDRYRIEKIHCTYNPPEDKPTDDEDEND